MALSLNLALEFQVFFKLAIMDALLGSVNKVSEHVDMFVVDGVQLQSIHSVFLEKESASFSISLCLHMQNG